jgi:hypothetical protein
MPGILPGIHAMVSVPGAWMVSVPGAWMAGTRPAMTE